jgi:hypothetical protein
MRSLAAGWYLWWRLGLAAFVTFFVVLILLLPVAEYPRSPVLVQRYWWGGILAVVLIVLHRLVDRTTRKWAPKTYGRTFEGSVWWGITWRTTAIAFVYESAIDLVGRLAGGHPLFARLHAGLEVLGYFLNVLASGWAMSVIVVKRLNESRAGGFLTVCRRGSYSPARALARLVNHWAISSSGGDPCRPHPPERRPAGT